MSDSPPEQTVRPKRRRRLPGAPTRRNCEIYERHVIAGETQKQVAAEFGISHQRVGQIAVRVEGWLATHGDHPLAARMRLRTNRRWEVIWSRAIEGFDRSREDREVKRERVARPTTSGEPPPPQERRLATFSETTIRQQNGDPRFLALAARVAEREDRRWQQAERLRALTELEERITALENEGREPSDDDLQESSAKKTGGETEKESPQADAPSDNAFPPEKTTAAVPREEEKVPARRETTRFGTATRPHPSPRPKGEGTAETAPQIRRHEKGDDAPRHIAEMIRRESPGIDAEPACSRPEEEDLHRLQAALGFG